MLGAYILILDCSVPLCNRPILYQFFSGKVIFYEPLKKRLPARCAICSYAHNKPIFGAMFPVSCQRRTTGKLRNVCQYFLISSEHLLRYPSPPTFSQTTSQNPLGINLKFSLVLSSPFHQVTCGVMPGEFLVSWSVRRSIRWSVSWLKWVDQSVGLKEG